MPIINWISVVLRNMAKFNVPPVFVKSKDVPDYMTLHEYDVYSCAKDVVGVQNVIGCQRIGGLWRIYVSSVEDRIKLITKRLTIRNQLVNVYSDNPFRTGIQSPEEEIVRLTIKGIPLSKDNSGLEVFLQHYDVETTRPIQYAQIRNPVTKELTDAYSGDRIVYAKPLTKHIPRNCYIGNTKVIIYYDGQEVPKRDMLCTNCYSTEHYRSKCSSPTACKSCRKPGHTLGDDVCDATRATAYKQITVFQGKDDVLSNFYPCEINCHGILAKSSEHAYQYVKAIRRGELDVAKNVKDAPTAYLAKQAGNKLPYCKNWNNQKVDVMKDIVKEKSKQVPEFNDVLMETKSSTLVEAVAGEMFWASGLNKQNTLFTKKNYWFGENNMGRILMDLRTELLTSFTEPGKKNKKSSRNKKPDEKQINDEENNASASESDHAD